MRADPADLRHHRAAVPCEGELQSGAVCTAKSNYSCQRCSKGLCGRHGLTHWCEPKAIAP